MLEVVRCGAGFTAAIQNFGKSDYQLMQPQIYLPWWPSCLDRGALNNVDAPGCGTSVVRGPTGHR